VITVTTEPPASLRESALAVSTCSSARAASLRARALALPVPFTPTRPAMAAVTAARTPDCL
jgi:hypothetical protein